MVAFNITSLSMLITANHILHYHSVLDAYGHISVRNPCNASTFFISRAIAPALVSSPDDIVEINIADASPVHPNAPRTFVEMYIHSEIFKRFDKVHCVVHSHSPQVLQYSVTQAPLKAIYHMAGFLGDKGVPIFDAANIYEQRDNQNLLITNTKLGAALASDFTVNATTADFPDPPVVLMRGHGFAVAAASIEQAVFFAMYTQSNAALQAGAATLQNTFAGDKGSGVRYLSEREGRDAWAANQPIIFKPWELWRREVRTMGRGLYVNELEQENVG